jgi:3-hydroxyisobutyrate dehydrogenase
MAIAVAVIGLGIMGSGMARNLLRAGFDVTVYNRSRAKAEALGAEGARVAATPTEAAQGAEVVISMVADDDASRAVWLGEEGALAAVAPGAVLVESSTVTVGWVRELAEKAAGRGVELLDAPVTGSRDQAAGGQLLFLVGGAAAALERVRPVLAAMSRDAVYLGPSGSGATLKLINNFLCGVQAASLAEAFGMLERAGLDREQALGVLLAGAPASPIVKGLAGRMAAEEYTPPHFALRLMTKDLRYAVEEGARHGVKLRTGVAAREVMERGVEAGFGERDMSAVVEQFRASRSS